MGQQTDHDEEADFAAVFNADEPAPDTAAGTPEPEQREPDQTPPADENTPDEQAAPPDPFAALPPEVRVLLEDIPKLRRELADTKAVAGRVGSLQKELDRLKADRAATAPQEKPKYEKVEAIRQDLPEVADAIEELASRLSQRQEPQQDEARTEPDTSEVLESAKAKLSRLRPSWEQDKDSREYQQWLATQPADYQHELRTTLDPAVFLDSLAKWDLHVARTPNPTATARTQRLTQAVTPRGAARTTRPSNEYDEEADMEAGFKS